MKYCIFLWMALLALGLAACDKKQKGTFTVKGRLIKDCDTPLMGRRIYALEQIQFGHGKDEIGSVTTDADGYFELVCGYYSRIPKEVKGLPGEYETPNNMTTGTIIELGTIYQRFSASVCLRINVLSNAYANDTLFVKDPFFSNALDAIHPLSQGESFHIFSFDEDVDWGGDIRNEENNASYINYSIDTVNGSSEYHINYCGLSKDTVTITLP
ncbi:MAG: hypothetical protein QM642_03275 [Edaphocola sp.]